MTSTNNGALGGGGGGIGGEPSGFSRPNGSAPYSLFDRIERSENDTRLYRLLRLDNQLEALLIHDKDTDKSSAALDVQVGSLADPPNLQGLAHFCEHMLFLGTDKYPAENEYNRYLTEHGGHSNAYTSQEHTNYYFEVNHPALEGALDRFARFFIAPRFDASCTEREMRAVDSEHKKNLQSDSWRFYQLEKSLAQPGHPYTLFSTGSLETLKDAPEQAGVDVRDALLDFHKKYYSANQMKLVVLGRESLDQLTDWVVGRFMEVPNTQRADSPSHPHPYDPTRQMRLLTARPIKDNRTLELVWPFPDQDQYYRVQPGSYLGHMLGHEGEGSILSLLKRHGWVNYLSAGCSGGCRGFDFFKVTVDLTEEGLARYADVVAVIYRYVALLRQSGIEEWRFDETRRLSVMNFRFQDKIPPASYASNLAGQLHQPYPREWVLSGGNVIRDYDATLIRDCLAMLRPDNVNITVRAQSFPVEGMDKERWYGTEYRNEPLPSELAERLKRIAAGEDKVDADLHLPLPNEFIPSDFETHKREIQDKMKQPNLVLNTPVIRLWHKKDDTFWLPRANAWFFFKNPLCYVDPRHAILSRIYIELIKDSLNEYAYSAEVSGLSYNYETHQEGIELFIEGYQHKMPLLLNKVVERMKQLQVDPARFVLIKEQLFRAYKNFSMEAPYQHAMYRLSYLIQEKLWLHDESLAQFDSISVDDLVAYYPQFLRNLHIEAVVHGNIEESVAVDMVQQVAKAMTPTPLFPSQLLPLRCIMLPEAGVKYVYQCQVPNADNPNSAIEYLCYVGDVTNKRTRAMLSLMAQVVQEPCFDQLRTKEQLGYLVFSGIRMQPGAMGLRVLLQSERHPVYLEHRIESFLIQLETVLNDMTEETFQRHVKSLCDSLLEKDKNMYEESRRYWHHVYTGYYEFNKRFTDVTHLRTFTKAQLLAFYRRYIDPRARTQRKLSVHFVSQKLEILGAVKETAAEEAAAAEQLADHAADLAHARTCLNPLGVELSDDRLSAALRAVDTEAELRRTLLDAATDTEDVDALIRRFDAVLSAEDGLLAQWRKRREDAIREGDGTRLSSQNRIIRDAVQWKAGMPLAPAPYPAVDISTAKL